MPSCVKIKSSQNGETTLSFTQALVANFSITNMSFKYSRKFLNLQSSPYMNCKKYTLLAFSYECLTKKKSYFSVKTYVVATQKNGLYEKVLLSTQTLLKLMGKICNGSVIYAWHKLSKCYTMYEGCPSKSWTFVIK